MVKLSIIIPNYNNERYIKQCIQSVLKQTFTDYEMIIIDDGSCDDSIKIIESTLKGNDKIKLIKQYNQNASVARNRGIDEASGEFMLFLDGDDCLNDKESLENMVNNIRRNDLLISNYKIINENNVVIGQYRINDDMAKNGKDIIEKYAFVSAVPTNKLYRAEIIHEHNIYFDNVDIGQDLNFYLKYLAVCNKITTIEKYTYNYRINNAGMTRKPSSNMFDIVKSIDCVRHFYKINHIKNMSIIDAVAFLNYSAQMNKIEMFDRKTDKKFIYNYFDYYIKKLKIENKYKKMNAKFQRVTKTYKIKKMFKMIYLSSYYKKFKQFFKV